MGAPGSGASKPAAAKEKGGICDPKGAGVVSSGAELPPIPFKSDRLLKRDRDFLVEPAEESLFADLFHLHALRQPLADLVMP